MMDATESGNWQPGSDLRARLLHGIFAAIIAAGLNTAGTAMELNQPNQSGWTVPLVLGLVAVIPQAVVLLAFLGLARETASDGLKRGAIGVFGSTWLFSLLSLFDETILPDGAILAVGIFAFIAFVVLIEYCFRPLVRQNGIILVVFLLIGFQILKRLTRQAPVLKQIDPSAQWFLILGAMALITAIVLTVWFGLSLVRLRNRLGGIAVVAGVGYWLALAAILVVGGWFTVEFVAAIDRPGASDKELEDVMGPQLQILHYCGLAVDWFITGLTVGLFHVVRRRGAHLGQPVFKVDVKA